MSAGDIAELSCGGGGSVGGGGNFNKPTREPGLPGFVNIPIIVVELCNLLGSLFVLLKVESLVTFWNCDGLRLGRLGGKFGLPLGTELVMVLAAATGRVGIPVGPTSALIGPEGFVRSFPP